MLKRTIWLLPILFIACKMQQQAGTSKAPEALPENQPLIIEGTVISEKRSYFTHNIYTSCLVEVNTVFSGELHDKVIEVITKGGAIGKQFSRVSDGSSYLPPIHSTAIFRLGASNQESMKGQTPFKLFYPLDNIETVFPETYDAYRHVNLEKTVYQPLEAAAGKARQLILPPATNNKVAIDYSIQKKQLLPNRTTGLVFDVMANSRPELPDQMGLTVVISSASSVVYLQQAALEIGYNTKAFGDSIVAKGMLKCAFARNYNPKTSTTDTAAPPGFDMQCTDVGPGKIRLTWVNKAPADSCWQIYPAPYHVADLYMLALNKDEPVNLTLTGVDSLCMRYDYTAGKMAPFAYIATPETYRLKAVDLLPVFITSVTPERVLQAGDTVTVSGQNFGKHAAVSLFSKDETTHFRDRDVPESFVLARTDTTFTFVVPPFLLPNRKDDTGEIWYPATGKLTVKKGLGDFTVYKTSKKDLVLKTTPFNSRN